MLENEVRASCPDRPPDETQRLADTRSSVVRCQTDIISIDEFMLRVGQRMTGLVERPTGTVRLPRFHGHDAATYHLASGGSRVRARLAYDAGRALGLASDDIVAIAAAAELLHNASLIHDDLQDRDRVRRNRDAVWVRYGSDLAICTGDLFISAAFASIVSLGVKSCLSEAVSLMHERVASAVGGQGADLSFKARTLSDLSIYDAIAAAKSGALMSLPLELAFIAAQRSDWCAAARQAVESFAIGYQIADDIDDASHIRSLNIIGVLKALGSADPLGAARRLATDRLANASRLARALPEGSGAALAAISERLSARLIEEGDLACALS